MSTRLLHDGLSQTKLSDVIYHKKLKDDAIYMLDSLPILTQTWGMAKSIVILSAIWYVLGCVVGVVGNTEFLSLACQ